MAAPPEQGIGRSEEPRSGFIEFSILVMILSLEEGRLARTATLAKHATSCPRESAPQFGRFCCRTLASFQDARDLCGE